MAEVGWSQLVQVEDSLQLRMPILELCFKLVVVVVVRAIRAPVDGGVKYKYPYEYVLGILKCLRGVSLETGLTPALETPAANHCWNSRRYGIRVTRARLW